MKKILFISLMIAAVSSFETVSAQNGGFPFYRSFLDGKMDQVEKPEPNNPNPGTGVDRGNKAVLVPDLGLQLTTLKSEVGAFYLPNHPFTTDDGLLIEFEYMMYPTGGSSNVTDGITMFLVDADKANNLEYGAEGAGFGYTHRWTNPSLSRQRIRGILGGYLSIALDQSNFKGMRMEGQEQRNGIAYMENESWTTSAKLKKYNTRSNVTIRGSAGPGRKQITSTSPLYTMEEGFWGYPVLITRHTGGTADAGNMRNQACFKLDPATGMFDQIIQDDDVMPDIPLPFDIAGGGRFTTPLQSQYRKAIIKLETNPDNSIGGFMITVSIRHGNDETTVIRNFTYPATLKYIENGLPIRIVSETPVYYGTPPIIEYTVETPKELIIGFTASTGTVNDYTNVIKNLRITPLLGTNTANDDILGHRRGPAVILPFENDIAYQGTGSSAVGHKDYIDPDSFRFWTDEYTLVKDPSGKILFECEIENEGKWFYDPTRSEVLFFPDKGFTGTAAIMYDIKGKHSPYDEEKFRSSLAKISVQVADNQPTT